MPDIVRNGDLDIKQRIDLIKRCFLIGDIDLLSEEQQNNSFYLFKIGINGKIIDLHVLIKNVVNSGWSDKPLIKRIQVKSFKIEELQTNTEETCSMFLGIAYANEIPIFIVWNPFMFVYHNTVRSCYIDVELIVRCHYEGLIKTTSSKQKVMLCDPNHFKDMILTYLEDNKIGKL